MKIAVLNGSPKGDISVTMQYVKYMEKKFPQHEFIYLNVAHNIKRIEQDQGEWDSVMETIKSSEGALWAFPLYVMMVHANYKRFIELIWERRMETLFKDKYAAVIATSIHFYDHTAVNYIHAICDDLKMRFIDSFSADMKDLTKEYNREQLMNFAQNFFRSINNKTAALRAYLPVQKHIKEYIPSDVKEPIDSKGQKLVIVTDSLNQEENIGRMVDRFQKLTRADVIDISAIKINGSCTGCLQCGFDNRCIYSDNDDIRKVYLKLKEYDVIVFAGTIKDRYLSARWKMFVDRRFFITHQPHFTGKQMGYLISGPLGQIPNLREIIQANTEFDQANLVGILTDEYETSQEIDKRMEVLAQKMVDFALEGYFRPDTFLGVGGMKIFRDDIWGRLRFIFPKDHQYYKKHGVYDFPQKQYGIRVLNLILPLIIKIPAVKKNIQKNMKEYMIRPYQDILKNK